MAAPTTEIVYSTTTVWDDTYNCKNPDRLKTQYFKRTLTYPIIEHPDTYAQRRPGQRGAAKISQSFIISRAYPSDRLSDEVFQKLRTDCHAHNLQLKYANSTFKDGPAWLIVIADRDVDIDLAFEFAKTVPDEE